MVNTASSRVAIIDYGLGNLFSINQACTQVGLQAFATSSRKEIQEADAVILPGVGAFGDAISSLIGLDLVSPLRYAASSGKPLLGICLGMQLLMTESFEFGHHEGLGIIEGSVISLSDTLKGKNHSGLPVKIPQVGWNRINWSKDTTVRPHNGDWNGTFLDGLKNGQYMYFVHSYHVQLRDNSIMTSTTQYGGVNFCSSFMLDNIWACQFHPERSGQSGLTIYKNLADSMKRVANQ